MRGIHTCCPEAPSTININQNIIQMDGTRAFWLEVYFTGADYNSMYAPVGGLSLAFPPYTRSQTTLVMNSGVQRYGHDFVINGSRLALNFTPAAGDLFQFKYFALTDSTSTIVHDSSIAVGTMVGFGGSGEVPGWHRMDGSTPRPKGNYPQLWAFLETHSDLLESSDATTFTLKLIQSPFYDGNTLVTGATIIKHD